MTGSDPTLGGDVVELVEFEGDVVELVELEVEGDDNDLEDNEVHTVVELHVEFEGEVVELVELEVEGDDNDLEENEAHTIVELVESQGQPEDVVGFDDGWRNIG